MWDQHREPPTHPQGCTWQLAIQLVPGAEGEAEHVGEVLLQLLGDLLLQPSHDQAHQQGREVDLLILPSPSQCTWSPPSRGSTGAATSPSFLGLILDVGVREGEGSLQHKPTVQNRAWLF